VRWRSIDLGTRTGLRQWLTAGRAGLFADDGWDGERIVQDGASREPELTIRLVIASALHIGGGRSSDTQEHHANRASILRESGAVVVPASTWKGLLWRAAVTS
jgi:hypothetical protein